MLVRTLQRLEPFQQLRQPELRTVARHAQILNLPAHRWLLRPPRKLSGAYYLLRGRLTLWPPKRLLQAQDSVAAAAFYPGCSAARALSPVQILHINTAPIAFLWEVVGTSGLQTPVADDAWLDRFLSSPMLQQLDPARWQRLMRSATHLQAIPGQAIVTLGEPGQAFYVLKHGRALVERPGQQLALLGPGDFFGEDALVTDAPRNATVRMQTHGDLLVLPKERFLQYLVAYIVGKQRLVPTRAGAPVALWVAEHPPPSAASFVHLPLSRFREDMGRLGRTAFYHVAGGSFSQRALAILLLAQQGLQADYAADGPYGLGTAELGRHGPIASPAAQLGDAFGTHDGHGISSMNGG